MAKNHSKNLHNHQSDFQNSISFMGISENIGEDNSVTLGPITILNNQESFYDNWHYQTVEYDTV